MSKRTVTAGHMGEVLSGWGGDPSAPQVDKATLSTFMGFLRKIGVLKEIGNYRAPGVLKGAGQVVYEIDEEKLAEFSDLLREMPTFPHEPNFVVGQNKKKDENGESAE